MQGNSHIALFKDCIEGDRTGDERGGIERGSERCSLARVTDESHGSLSKFYQLLML